jgi:hypothetical protein
MRLAAIADIHGNHLALDAVLADIHTQGIDQIVNLGDMASGPLDARKTMDRLMTTSTGWRAWRRTAQSPARRWMRSKKLPRAFRSH